MSNFSGRWSWLWRNEWRGDIYKDLQSTSHFTGNFSHWSHNFNNLGPTSSNFGTSARGKPTPNHVLYRDWAGESGKERGIPCRSRKSQDREKWEIRNQKDGIAYTTNKVKKGVREAREAREHAKETRLIHLENNLIKERPWFNRDLKPGPFSSKKSV